jgi:hypothetical protein
MARSLGVLGLLLLDASIAFAQPLVIDPAHRPPAFSNIVGKYDIKVSAEPADVQVEQSITLRIQITGVGPEKYEPNRKHLNLFPEAWKNDFYVQPMQDQDEVNRDKRTWTFVYRLKPKHVKIDAIDDIELVYYDPEVRDKKKYVTKYAPAIKITVKPRPDKSGETPVEVIAAPASFYEQAGSTRVLAGSTALALSTTQLALFLMLPPLACLVGALAWRRCFPDEARRARQHRDSSAARALGLLQAADVSAWDVVLRYLRERLDFTAQEATPAEAATFLKRRGFAKSLSEQARAFFHACDAARFRVGVAVDQAPLADGAVRLIEALEADPCARG